MNEQGPKTANYRANDRISEGRRVVDNTVLQRDRERIDRSSADTKKDGEKEKEREREREKEKKEQGKRRARAKKEEKKRKKEGEE